MTLVQLLLPLFDNNGQRVPRRLHRQVRTELTERFGGLTAYNRAPAQGLWKDPGNPDDRTAHDDIVVYEVMCEQLERDWWRKYRTRLERRFRQHHVVVRAQEIELL